MAADSSDDDRVEETRNRPDRPTLIYDDEDPLCRRAIERWRVAAHDGVAWLPRSRSERDFPDIPSSQLTNAPTLVMPSGEIISGAKAIVRAWDCGGRRAAWFFYRRY